MLQAWKGGRGRGDLALSRPRGRSDARPGLSVQLSAVRSRRHLLKRSNIRASLCGDSGAAGDSADPSMYYFIESLREPRVDICLYPNRVDRNLISDTNHPDLVSDLTNEGLRSSRDCPHFRCQPGAPKPPSLLTMWLQIQGFLGPSEV